MAKAPTKSTEKPIEKTSSVDKEIDPDEDFDAPDFVSLSDDADKDMKKLVARRKIEIYWEKKRLKDQFDDFEDSEFDF